MSEQLANLYSTTLAAPYVAGSGSIVVTSAGSYTQGTFSLTILDGSGNVILIFRVTGVVGTTFSGAAEGADANAAMGSTVVGSMLTVASLGQIEQDWLYGDPVTSPTTATFSVALNDANANTISFANATGTEPAVALAANCSGVDTAVVARLIPVPAAPYNVRVRFRVLAVASRYPLNGFCWYDSVSGKLMLFGTMARDDVGRVRFVSFTNSHSFDGSTDQELHCWGWPGRNGLFDLYAQDDGTNRIGSLVADGTLADKEIYLSQGNTVFLTPTHIGIFVGPGNNGASPFPSKMTCIDWTVTT